MRPPKSGSEATESWGGPGLPTPGSESACSACVCTLYGDSIAPRPRGSLRNSTGPSRSSGRHPQPTASQSHPQGLPLLGPGPPHWLSYPHTLYGRLKLVVLAVVSRFLTQAPCPLTDPNAACPGPAARQPRGGVAEVTVGHVPAPAVAEFCL